MNPRASERSRTYGVLLYRLQREFSPGLNQSEAGESEGLLFLCTLASKSGIRGYDSSSGGNAHRSILFYACGLSYGPDECVDVHSILAQLDVHLQSPGWGQQEAVKLTHSCEAIESPGAAPETILALRSYR